MKVQNLTKIQEEGKTNINVILYGAPGVGKTTLAASISKVGKTLLVDAECGATFLPAEYAKNIDILRLEDVAELDEVLDMDKIKEYDCVILDSVTEIGKKLQDKVKGGKESLSVNEWGKVIDKLETYFRRFRDLGKNVVLVAVAQEKDDDGVLRLRPSLSGKNLPAAVIGYQDVCIYLESNPQGRVGHTVPADKHYAKHRGSKLPAELRGEELDLKFVYDRYAQASRLCTKEEIEGLQKLGEQAKITEEGWVKALKFVGAKDIGALTMSQMLKLTASLEEKIKLIK